MDLHKVYLVVFLLKLALVVVLMVWPKVRWFLTEKCERPSNTLSQQTSPIVPPQVQTEATGGPDQPSRHPV